MSLTSRGITILSNYILRQALNTTRTQVQHYKRWVAPTLRELQRRKNKMPEQKPVPRSSYLEWNYDAEIYAFSKRLNEEFDKKILKQALTHRSYVFKMQQEADKNGQESVDFTDNKEMIEAGEKLLHTYVCSKYTYPTVIVDSIKQYLLNEEKLAYIARHLGLTDLILTEEYPLEVSTLANTLKAIISALELSSGPERTEKFIDDFVITQMNDLDVFDIWEPSEPFKYLMESMLKGKKVEPRLCNQSATNTILANYQVGLYSEDKKLLGIGWGESIDTAKNTAALDAIRKIYKL